MSRRTLAICLAISLSAHLLLAAAWLIRFHHAPLAGGGAAGAGFVSVNIEPAPSPTASRNRLFDRLLGQPVASLRSRRGENQRPLNASPARASSSPSGSGPAGNDPLLANIRLKIEQAKRYPEFARRSGLEGVSIVKFRIDETGSAEEVSLQQSSGQSILDQEALETVRRAAPFPKYDEPLTVAIRFSMGKEKQLK